MAWKNVLKRIIEELEFNRVPTLHIFLCSSVALVCMILFTVVFHTWVLFSTEVATNMASMADVLVVTSFELFMVGSLYFLGFREENPLYMQIPLMVVGLGFWIPEFFLVAAFLLAALFVTGLSYSILWGDSHRMEKSFKKGDSYGKQ